MKKITRRCKGCGKEFSSNDIRREYCSSPCKQKSYHLRKKVHPKLLRYVSPTRNAVPYFTNHCTYRISK